MSGNLDNVPTDLASDVAVRTIDRVVTRLDMDPFETVQAQIALLCSDGRFDVAAEVMRRVFDASEEEILGFVENVCNQAGIDSGAAFWQVWGAGMLLTDPDDGGAL